MRKLKDVFSPLDLIKDQEAVMEYFLGIKVEKGMVECPLRKETHPSCSF